MPTEKKEANRLTNPININHIDHVVIRADNLNNMIAFYHGVLGCRLERHIEELGLAQLRAGQSLIDLVDAHGKLGQMAGSPPDHSAPNMDHVCFQVQPWDTEAIQQHLSACEVDSDPVGTRYGATGPGPSIYLRDPEGNTVELKGY